MKNGRMQAKDITTLAFVQAVVIVGARTRCRMTSRWNVRSVLAGHPEHVDDYTVPHEYPGLPDKVVLAKARQLLKASIIDGCPCGCRGDYDLMPDVADALGLVAMPDIGGGWHAPYGIWVPPEAVPKLVRRRDGQRALTAASPP